MVAGGAPIGHGVHLAEYFRFTRGGGFGQQDIRNRRHHIKHQQNLNLCQLSCRSAREVWSMC